MIKRFFSDLSLRAVVAGFVAVLVGFTSSVVIVLGTVALVVQQWRPAATR